MSLDQKNIDLLFKDNLLSIQEKPPQYAWDRLKEDILAVKRNRRIIIYRWVVGAAAILIAFVTGYYFALHNLKTQQFSELPEQYVQSQITEQTIPSSNSQITPDQAAIVTSEDVSGHVTARYQKVQKEIIPVAKLQTDNISAGKKSSTNDLYGPVSKESAVAIHHLDRRNIKSLEYALPDIKMIPTGQIMSPVTDLSSMAFGMNHNNSGTEPEIKKGKIFTYGDKIAQNTNWSVGGKFSPLYSYRDINILQEDLPPNVISDKQYYNDVENGIYSFTGGVDVAYQIRDSWQIQSGLLYSRSGQINQDVIALQYPGDKNLFLLCTSTGIININTASLPKELSDRSFRHDTTENVLYVNTNVYQRFETIEIPLLLRYQFLKKRFGLHITGGLSPGILVGKSAYFEYENTKFDLDREGEFYPVIYNGVVGIGMDYSFTKKLRFHMSPTYKHALFSIRKDHSVQYFPYSFSLFTGISYSF